MAASQSEKLPRRAKLLYGLGDWGFSMTSTMLSVFFAMFLSDVVHLDLQLAAMAIFIGRSWDWINDPLVGYLSDRTRSRWGRRRPFLLFGAIPFGLGFAMLWWTPPLSSQLWLAVYYGVAYLLFDTLASLAYMPYFALTPELTLDYDERTSLTAYRMFFSIVAGLVAFVVPGMLIGAFQPENAGRVAWVGLLFGLTSALPLLGTFFGTRERREFQQQPQASVRQSLRAVFHNRPFLFAVGVFLLTWMTVDLLQPMLLYFLKYWLNMEAQRDLILGTVFVVAALALPLWNWAVSHWDKQRAYVLGIGFLGVVLIVLAFLQPGVSLAFVVLLAALAGVGISAAHVLPWSIIPDAVEWDELQTGQRHEGTFYSLITLMQKIGASLVVPGALLLLDRSGYVPNAAQQAPEVLRAIRFLVGGAPALLLIGGIAFALLYPLTRERHLAVRKELEDRRT
ncbi:MAG TPA: MFS transporter [Anaerolineae bacterium]|nr:MFS transporter [Anaerolineae bacterium]